MERTVFGRLFSMSQSLLIDINNVIVEITEVKPGFKGSISSIQVSALKGLPGEIHAFIMTVLYSNALQNQT